MSARAASEFHFIVMSVLGGAEKSVVVLKENDQVEK
jgi:hypothetical protein